MSIVRSRSIPAALRLGGVALALAVTADALPQESFVECTRVLHRFAREVVEDGSNRSLARVPDANGDGVDDLLVGSPGSRLFHQAGRLQLLDGRTFGELFRLDGVLDDALGHAVAAAGDLDGDGVGDLLASAPGIGAVRVYSGVNATTLLEVLGPAGAFGRSVASVGDVDHDGVPDIAVGEVSHEVTVPVRGRVSILSGANGGLIRALDGIHPNDHFGMELAAYDWNRDGIRELAVLANDFGVVGSRVTAFDLATGTALFDVRPSSTAKAFTSIAPVANVGRHPRVDRPGFVVLGTLDDLGSIQPVDMVDRGIAFLVDGETGAIGHEIVGALGEFFDAAADLGDPNNDRETELVVAGRGPDDGPDTIGWAAVVSANTGRVLRRIHLTSGTLADVLAGPDLDGDGARDLVLSRNTMASSEVLVVASTSPVVRFGSVTPGTGSVAPQLSIAACPRVQGTLRFETQRVVGGALGALVLGGTRASQPFFGGTLHPSRDFRKLHRASGARGVAGAGDASISIALPDDPALAGLTFYAQAAYRDGGAIQGMSLTQALELTLY